MKNQKVNRTEGLSQWHSTINLDHLNNGGSLIHEGVEFVLGGKELYCRKANSEESLQACGDMKADDFILMLIGAEQKA